MWERKPRLSPAGPRTPVQVLRKERARAVGQRRRGPFILSPAREDVGQDPGPKILSGGWKEGCLGPEGSRPPTGLGGTALYWVRSAQIPGRGSNLALPVWLSPDTRGPATKKAKTKQPGPGQGQPVGNTLFVQGLVVGGVWAGWAGRARSRYQRLVSPGEGEASSDFQGRSFT